MNNYYLTTVSPRVAHVIQHATAHGYNNPANEKRCYCDVKGIKCINLHRPERYPSISEHRFTRNQTCIFPINSNSRFCVTTLLAIYTWTEIYHSPQCFKVLRKYSELLPSGPSIFCSHSSQVWSTLDEHVCECVVLSALIVCVLLYNFLTDVQLQDHTEGGKDTGMFYPIPVGFNKIPIITSLFHSNMTNLTLYCK